MRFVVSILMLFVCFTAIGQSIEAVNLTTSTGNVSVPYERIRTVRTFGSGCNVLLMSGTSMTVTEPIDTIRARSCGQLLKVTQSTLPVLISVRNMEYCRASGNVATIKTVGSSTSITTDESYSAFLTELLACVFSTGGSGGGGSTLDDDFLNAQQNGLTTAKTGAQNATALNLLLPTRKYIYIPLNVNVDYTLVNLNTVGNRGCHIFDENYGGYIANGGIVKISDNGSTPTVLMGGLRNTDEINFYLQPGLSDGGNVRTKIDIFHDRFIDPKTGVNTQDYSTAGLLVSEAANTRSMNLPDSLRYTTVNPNGSTYPLRTKGDRYLGGVWSFDINTKVNGDSPQFGYTPGIRFTTQDGAFAPFALYQYKSDFLPQLRQTGAVWKTGLSVNIGEYILYNSTGNGTIYQATTAGTTGATPPTHQSGTVSDGGVSWAFVSTAYDSGTQSSLAVFNGSLQPGTYVDSSYFELPAGTKTIGAYFNGCNIAFAPQNEDVGLYWFRNGAGYKNAYSQPEFTTGALTSIVHKRNSGDLYLRNYHNAGSHELRMSSTFMQHLAGGTLGSTKTVTSGAVPDATDCDILRLNYGSPTTVTNFTGNGNQILYITSNNSNVTLQHGTSIFMNSSANLTLQANKTYIFTRSGSLWFESSSSQPASSSSATQVAQSMVDTAVIMNEYPFQVTGAGSGWEPSVWGGATSGVAQPIVGRPGLGSVSVNATANAGINFSYGSGNAGTYIANAGGRCRVAVRHDNLPTNTDSIVSRFGFINRNLNVTSGTPGMYFEVRTLGTAAYVVRCVTSNAGVATITDVTGSAGTLLATFKTFEVRMNTATSAQFFIDNVLVATHATNVNPGTTDRLFPAFVLARSGAGVTVITPVITVDYIMAAIPTGRL